MYTLHVLGCVPRKYFSRLVLLPIHKCAHLLVNIATYHTSTYAEGCHLCGDKCTVPLLCLRRRIEVGPIYFNTSP